ncbi:MAG: hypothetical protein ACRD20_16645 [Terriglobales bacterium]
MQWLRDKGFASLETYDEPQRQGWKYLVGALVLVAAGFAYLHWAPKPRTGAVSSIAASAPQVSPPAPLPVQKTSSPEPSNPQAVRPSAAGTARVQTPAPGGLQAAAEKSSLLGAVPSGAPRAVDASGVSELRLAQRYLGGSMGVRDSSEAAKLLWKAVAKQNATAEVLLSDLYLRGDGVPRSCDQARLLLLAAAKRGAPEASQQLRNLDLRGCH